MTFILDTSTLGTYGATVIETVTEDVGRAITVEWENGNVDEEFILYGYSLRYYPTESESKETAP